ncbi:MAG: EI24 domain-containing protein [Campylobacter sp.]|nr:EI24 domain-containing protein [Campylobacter sp.]
MTHILQLSLKDFFTLKFLKYSLVPFIVSFIFLGIFAFFGFSLLLEYFNSIFGEGNGLLAWFYSFAIVHFFIGVLSFLLTSFIFVFASVFLAIFITSFLTPYIAKEINNKYYHHEVKNKISSFKIFFCMFLILIKFIGFFALATLLLLMPFINLFVYYVVIYYLFHKLLVLDVASSVLDRDEFEIFNSTLSPLEFKFSTLCFYIISSVPLLGILLQVFFVIFLTHLFYQKTLKLNDLNPQVLNDDYVNKL